MIYRFFLGMFTVILKLVAKIMRENAGTMKMAVGIQSDGSIDLDFAHLDEHQSPRWSNNNLTLEQAEFVLEELASVVDRVQARLRQREQLEADTQQRIQDAYQQGKAEAIKELRSRF